MNLSAKIEVQRGNCEALEHFLADRIYEFNAQATGYFDGESFSATQKDSEGAVVAGITGYTWGGCCFVSNLWVSESIRGSGVGRGLLVATEHDAIARGCSVVLLSTHSFQSPAFYERMGYERRAVIIDHPVGFSNIFYSKRLSQS
ncbi:MAG: GNAT family N-acetyltransferase [Gemmatimonadaceae bacterium]